MFDTSKIYKYGHCPKYTSTQISHLLSRPYMPEKLKAMMDSVSDNTIFVIILNGGAWYGLRLLQELNIKNPVYFIKCSSYVGKERGEIKWDFIPEFDAKGKDIILIDDIWDSGSTIRCVTDAFLEMGASVVRSTVLIHRGVVDEMDPCDTWCAPLIIDSSGDFFMGMGMDDNGKGRALNDIYIL